MNIKKILHITNWYPNKWDNLEGVFIKEQFKLFAEVTESHLINVQVREGKKLIEYKYIRYSDTEEGYYLLTKIKSNRIIELLTTLLLLWALFKSNYKKYDLLHFHIAYPLLIHYFLWKKIIKVPIIISEHWSAYHFNFYMPWRTNKLNKVKRIFKQGIPIVTVSKALKNDIEKFSNTKQSISTVIPNVIDKQYFYYKKSKIKNKKPTFFTVNIWRSIKNPFPMLEAFKQLSMEGIDFQLIIGGYGELIKEMELFVLENYLEQKIIFLGKMDKQQIADHLTHSDAYLFSSEYETFSVACAQALSLGCPLIGPALPAILEYATINKDIIVLKENTSKEWVYSLKLFIQNISSYNPKKISKKASDYLSHKNIQKKYQDFIDYSLQNMEQK